jgi:uncharacterized protein (TIGR02246 family)
METPLDTVNRLVRAIDAGDLTTAVELYEPEALLVVRPGQVARGSSQLREALAGFVTLRATVTSEAQHVLEAGDLALYVGRWSLRGMDPAGKPVMLTGESTDILRRHEDGRWLIAVDNPWGAQALARPELLRSRLTRACSRQAGRAPGSVRAAPAGGVDKEASVCVGASLIARS